MKPALLKLLDKPASSAELSAAIAEAEGQLPAARVAVAQLEGQRAGVLLRGSDAEVEAHDARLEKARREVDRLGALLDTLRTRHAGAIAHEADEDLTRRRDVARDLAGKLLVAADEYDLRLAPALVAHVRRMGEMLREIIATMRALEAAGRSAEAADLSGQLPNGRAKLNSGLLDLADAEIMLSPARGDRWPPHQRAIAGVVRATERT
jgi:hypothetical protein